jgi:hypothetical protein
LFLPVFAPVSPFSCTGGFSLAVARPCIVIGAHRRPVNRLYFTSRALECTPIKGGIDEHSHDVLD